MSKGQAGAAESIVTKLFVEKVNMDWVGRTARKERCASPLACVAPCAAQSIGECQIIFG